MFLLTTTALTHSFEQQNILKMMAIYSILLAYDNNNF